MALEIVSEIWNYVKDGMSAHEREGLAEHMVTLMIENDYTPEEIREAFIGDSTIKSALQFYTDSEEDYDSEDEYEEYEEDEEDDDY